MFSEGVKGIVSTTQQALQQGANFISGLFKPQQQTQSQPTTSQATFIPQYQPFTSPTTPTQSTISSFQAQVSIPSAQTSTTQKTTSQPTSVSSSTPSSTPSYGKPYQPFKIETEKKEVGYDEYVLKDEKTIIKRTVLGNRVVNVEVINPPEGQTFDLQKTRENLLKAGGTGQSLKGEEVISFPITAEIPKNNIVLDVQYTKEGEINVIHIPKNILEEEKRKKEEEDLVRKRTELAKSVIEGFTPFQRTVAHLTTLASPSGWEYVVSTLPASIETPVRRGINILGGFTGAISGGLFGFKVSEEAKTPEQVMSEFWTREYLSRAGEPRNVIKEFARGATLSLGSPIVAVELEALGNVLGGALVSKLAGAGAGKLTSAVVGVGTAGAVEGFLETAGATFAETGDVKATIITGAIGGVAGFATAGAFGGMFLAPEKFPVLKSLSRKTSQSLVLAGAYGLDFPGEISGDILTLGMERGMRIFTPTLTVSPSITQTLSQAPTKTSTQATTPSITSAITSVFSPTISTALAPTTTSTPTITPTTSTTSAVTSTTPTTTSSTTPATTPTITPTIVPTPKIMPMLFPPLGGLFGDTGRSVVVSNLGSKFLSEREMIFRGLGMFGIGGKSVKRKSIKIF